jgi:hypothetical protein
LNREYWDSRIIMMKLCKSNNKNYKNKIKIKIIII